MAYLDSGIQSMPVQIEHGTVRLFNEQEQLVEPQPNVVLINDKL